MQFITGLLFLSLLFIVCFLVGALLVFRTSWLLAWLRANLGIGLLFISMAGCAGLVVLAGMTSLDGEVNFGTVTTHEIGVQQQLLTLDTLSVGARNIELQEQIWRLRAIQLRWSGLLDFIEVADGVLLYDLQQSDGHDGIIATTLEDTAIVKVWQFGARYLAWLPGVNFELVQTQWYPRSVSTVYDLTATSAGLRLSDRINRVKPRTAQVLFEQGAEQSGADQESATQAIVEPLDEDQRNIKNMIDKAINEQVK